MTSHEINGTMVELIQGDITEVKVDAIVNAANSSMAGGGGVDGAIHRAGGPTIMAELNEMREDVVPVEPGDAVVTDAGDLPAGWVIHAVGPRWKDGLHSENVKLEKAYWRSLELAADKEARSVAFPSISTGAYGFPVAEAAEIALMTIARYLMENPDTFERVLMVLFSDADYAAYSEEFGRTVRTKIGTK